MPYDGIFLIIRHMMITLKRLLHTFESGGGGGLEGDGLDNFCYQKINISPVSFSLFLHSVLIKLNLEKTVNIIFNDVNIPHAVLKQ